MAPRFSAYIYDTSVDSSDHRQLTIFRHARRGVLKFSRHPWMWLLEIRLRIQAIWKESKSTHIVYRWDWRIVVFEL